MGARQDYVHGHSGRERQRLADQADTLAELLHSDSPYARNAVGCLIEVQARAGGDSLIGRTLYPLLLESGFQHVTVSPRMVYVDSSRPHLVEGFTRNTFTAMIEGVREDALAAGGAR